MAKHTPTFWTALLGTLVDGYEAYGPFRNEDMAHEFAESFGEEWYSTVMPMFEPDNELVTEHDAHAADTTHDYPHPDSDWGPGGLMGVH